MGYWKQVFKRAAREAAKDLKLDTWAAAVIALIAQGIVSAGIWIALGHTMPAGTLWTRILTAAAPFLTFPIAFLIRFSTVPPKMAQESEKELARFAEKEAGNLHQLQEFYREGSVLALSPVATEADLEKLQNDAEKWFQTTIRWIDENISPSAATRFNDRSAWAAVVYRNAINQKHSDLMSLLSVLKSNLKEMIENPSWH